jgi:hypothetical protein
MGSSNKLFQKLEEDVQVCFDYLQHQMDAVMHAIRHDMEEDAFANLPEEYDLNNSWDRKMTLYGDLERLKSRNDRENRLIASENDVLEHDPVYAWLNELRKNHSHLCSSLHEEKKTELLSLAAHGVEINLTEIVFDAISIDMETMPTDTLTVISRLKWRFMGEQEYHHYAAQVGAPYVRMYKH